MMSEATLAEFPSKTGRSVRSEASTAKSSRSTLQDESTAVLSENGDKSNNESYEKLSTVHAQLLDALTCSTDLQALHVDVRNDSYWYHMRARMGPKKHAALIVKFHENSQRWEAYVFKMKLRDEDMEVVPKKTLVGNYKSKWLAYKHAEAAAKERDANPAKTRKLGEIMLPDKIKSTHFRILVVSEKFHHLDMVQRHRLVYEALVKAIGVNVIPIEDPLGFKATVAGVKVPGGSDPLSSGDYKRGLGRSAPTRLKLASIFGPTVCGLPLFRFLLPGDDTPLHLMVDARTPSQWRPTIYKPPLSERLGTAHNDLRALQINPAAKPRSHQVRVKKLTTVVDHQMLHQLELSQHHTSGGGSKHGGKRGSTSGSASSSLSGTGTSTGAMIPLPGTPLAIEDAHMGSALDDEGSLDTHQSHTSHSGLASPEKTSQVAKHLDSIGLDAAVSGVKYKKLGGIYGHFFNDLSSDIKELVMLKYKDNKNLIRDESNLEIMKFHEKMKKEAHAETNQPVTNISRMRAKQSAAALSGEYDKGTATEAEMMQEVNISNLKLERAAVRLQRIRRMYVWHRAVKLYWWQEYAAMTLQRCVRGHFGRLYAKLFRSLRPRAAMRIQRCFRTSQSRVWLRIWQFITYKLTRIILPKIKRFIRNCFLSWLRRRAVYAVRIQSMVRGFVGRCRYYKRLGELYYFQQVFPRAALKVQKVIRGFLGRCRMKRHLEAVLHRHIVVPAAIRLQRIYRGRLAKLELARLRVRAAAVDTLQKHIRAFVHRVWKTQMALELKRKRAATLLQKVYRGSLDRQLYRMKAHIRWYTTRYIPAIIFIQAVTRRYRAVNMVRLLKQRNRSVLKIQRSYEDYCQRKLAKAVVRDLKKMREFRAASIIQRYVRRRLAIIAFRRKKLTNTGRITAAAKIIMRAWTNYLLSRRYRHLLDEHRRKYFNHKIAKLIETREDVHLDIREIHQDIALATKAIERLKERVKLVENFRAQASIRQGRVKTEMSQLKVEDFERGKCCAVCVMVS
jgi:stress-induced morphogen